MELSKFISFECPEEGDFAIVFFAGIAHSYIAKHFRGKKILGAGFVKVKNTEKGTEVSAYGKSEGLGITSRPEDNRLVNLALGNV